jgi:hypothetical protein
MSYKWYKFVAFTSYAVEVNSKGLTYIRARNSTMYVYDIAF